MMHFFCLIIFFLGHAAFANTDRPEWVERARELIGEKAAIREQALKRLGEIFPTLESLRSELKGPNHHYALDVTVAMKYPGAAEFLLDQIETDKDGSLALSVNALLDQKNFKKIAERYLVFLQRRDLATAPTPVIMAMLDFYTHLRRGIPPELFKRLLTHQRLEIQQSAALHFSVTKFEDDRRAVEEHLKFLYPQVRAQILMTYYDSKDQMRAEKFCVEDQDPIVQSACQSLVFNKPKVKKKKGKK